MGARSGRGFEIDRGLTQLPDERDVGSARFVVLPLRLKQVRDSDQFNGR